MKQGVISEINNAPEDKAQPAEEKASVTVEDSYSAKPIVELLENDTVLEQDIYLRLTQSKYVKVCREGMILESRRLQTYIRKGVGSYYILKDLQEVA